MAYEVVLEIDNVILKDHGPWTTRLKYRLPEGGFAAPSGEGLCAKPV